MKLTFRRFDLRLVDTWRISSQQGVTKGKDFYPVVFVELQSEGIHGIGEGAPSSRYNESADTVQEFLRKVASCCDNTIHASMKAYSGILLVLVCAFWGPACSRPSGPPVRLVIPDEFRGLIKIVSDKKAPFIYLKGGEWVYRVPTNGTLRVRKDSGHENWHLLRANFASGAEIPTILARNSREVTLFSLGVNGQGVDFYFVGTEEEKNAAMEDSFHLLQ